MTCSVCGMAYAEGARVCVRCGSTLSEAPAPGDRVEESARGEGYGQQPAPGHGTGGPQTGAQPQPGPVSGAQPRPGPVSGAQPQPGRPGPQGYPSGRQPGHPPSYGGYPQQGYPSAPQQPGGYPGGPQQYPPAYPPQGYQQYPSGRQQTDYPSGPGRQQPYAPPQGYPQQGYPQPGGYPQQAYPQPGGYPQQQAYPQQQGGYQGAPFGQQPAWSTAQPQKSKKGVFALIGVGALVVIAAVAVALIFTVFKKNVFDNQKMAQDIQNSDEGKGLGLKDVTCPADQEVKKGKSFNCTAGDTKIQITVTDGDGHYNWLPLPQSGGK